MKKLKMLGTKHIGNRLYLRIKKDENLRDFLGEFLKDCGFENNLYTTEYKDENTNVSNFEDYIENNKNKKYDIDIIYCHEAIFILVNAKNEKQAETVKKIINKYCKFKK